MAVEKICTGHGDKANMGQYIKHKPVRMNSMVQTDQAGRKYYYFLCPRCERHEVRVEDNLGRLILSAEDGSQLIKRKILEAVLDDHSQIDWLLKMTADLPTNIFMTYHVVGLKIDGGEADWQLRIELLKNLRHLEDIHNPSAIRIMYYIRADWLHDVRRDLAARSSLLNRLKLVGKKIAHRPMPESSLDTLWDRVLQIESLVGP